MGYLQDAADLIRDAFAEENITPALDAIMGAVWDTTGSRSELSELLGELDGHLKDTGHPGEAGFCRAMKEAVDGFRGDGLGLEWFVTQALRVTGWAKPSPTLAARDYLETRRLRAAVAEAFVETRREILARRLERRREEMRREERRERVRGVAMTALAIGTLGISRAFEDL